MDSASSKIAQTFSQLGLADIPPSGSPLAKKLEGGSDLLLYATCKLPCMRCTHQMKSTKADEAENNFQVILCLFLTEALKVHAPLLQAVRKEGEEAVQGAFVKLFKALQACFHPDPPPFFVRDTHARGYPTCPMAKADLTFIFNDSSEEVSSPMCVCGHAIGVGLLMGSFVLLILRLRREFPDAALLLPSMSPSRPLLISLYR